MVPSKYIISLLLFFFFVSCNEKIAQSKINEEPIIYSFDTISMQGFVAFDEAVKSKRPVVLVLHEWWGLNNFIKERTRQLAALGYLAMAVDIYGNGKIADNPEDASQLAAPFFKDPQIAKTRFDAALVTIKKYDIADTNNIAAIGYSFGGAMVLNLARMGEDLKGVVSFYGSLPVTPPDKRVLKADVLVCHGDSDKFSSQEEVVQFKRQMDSIGAFYTFKSYPNASHGFSNPEATETGKKFDLPIAYIAAADSASFRDMLLFFRRIFK
jgi:dienelactone hydrolase